MSDTYGYARCSTNESRQDIGRQCRELAAMGVPSDHIYLEYESGASADRPEFSKLLRCLQPGDVLAATEVSRLTRSTAQLCDVLAIAQERHLLLRIGSLSIDCRSSDMDPMTKGMMLMWGVFAEMERDMVSARVRSGMMNAREKGRSIGRPKTTEADIPRIFMKHLSAYRRGDLNLSEFSRLCGLSRTTVYKYLDLLNGDH